MERRSGWLYLRHVDHASFGTRRPIIYRVVYLVPRIPLRVLFQFLSFFFMISPALVVVLFFALLVTAADLYKVLDGVLIVY